MLQSGSLNTEESKGLIRLKYELEFLFDSI